MLPVVTVAVVTVAFLVAVTLFISDWRAMGDGAVRAQGRLRRWVLGILAALLLAYFVLALFGGVATI